MSKLEVKVKKLNEKAVLPEYQSNGAAGLDLVATSVKTDLNKMGMMEIIGTGLAFEIPEGHVGLIFPRSSVSTKTTLSLANSVGVIDSDYRGEVTFKFRHTNPFFRSTYKIGDRVGQIIIMPIPSVKLVESQILNDTDRGENGYGSTGE